jgi:polysaccharide deacetylase 2 family uncharacterized protein YibQ
MNRRRFLHRLASLAGGPLLALCPMARALAAASPCCTVAPRVALIIDDIGFSLQRLGLFLDLDLALTFAVLPRLRFSAAAAAAAQRSGHQVLLHQPMQPLNQGLDPGPGALFVGDPPHRIRRIMASNLDGLPQALGVNNHMGSLFTAHRPEIQAALEVVRDNGLFFIDSLTSSRSRAYQTACRLNMPASQRNVFLDNRPEVPYILNQLQRLTTLACRTGLAVGLGHPHPQTAEAIGRFKTYWRQHGIEPIHGSQIFD